MISNLTDCVEINNYNLTSFKSDNLQISENKKYMYFIGF